MKYIAQAVGFLSVLILLSAFTKPHKQENRGPAVVAEPQFIGRFTHHSNGTAALAWSQSTITSQFYGTQVAVKLSDPNGNCFQATIDQQNNITFCTQPNQTIYPLASALPLGSHTITLIKITEASVGESLFVGFVLEPTGKLLPAPPPKTRRIQIIGDSISTGYGILCNDANVHFTPQTQNSDLTYGAITARNVNADVHIIAWSGIGMYHNNNGNTTHTMPAFYPLALPANSNSLWDFRQFVPDAVVINLGTNDFAYNIPGRNDTLLPEQSFVQTYLQFIKTVRQHAPQAYIFCALGPMLSDSYPADLHELSTARSYINQVVKTQQSTGDTRIAYIEFPTQTAALGYGCDYHPNTTTHQAMATQLTAQIKKTLGW